MSQRFKSETLQSISPEAEALAERVLKVSSDGLGGPFNMLLKSPQTGSLVMNQLDHFNGGQSLLSAPCRRLVQLMIARSSNAQYAWWAHAEKAVDRKEFTQAQVNALDRQERPEGLSELLEAVYDYVSDLIERPMARLNRLQRLQRLMSEAEIVDLLVLFGLYRLVGTLLIEGGIGQPETEPKESSGDPS